MAKPQVRLIRPLPADPTHKHKPHGIGDVARVLKRYSDAANREILLVEFSSGEQRIVLKRDVEELTNSTDGTPTSTVRRAVAKDVPVTMDVPMTKDWGWWDRS